MEYSKPIWIGKWEYEIVTVDFLSKKKILLERKIIGFSPMVWWCHRQKAENAERKKGAI